MSAGDDGIVKVFNYRQRKLLFSLTGHLDYIRSVAFHHEAPWIVSASDDQTIRIWNWQSRQSVAILSGHNHYVMCANFHPTEDLLVSASLDQTVRVWDLSTIRAKNAPANPSTSLGSNPGGRKLSSPQIDLFAGSGTETSVKFILEGHDRGVNWVQFHPTRPLILSGSDDRTVKIWRYNDVRAWEVETFRGHMNNVSAVMWHPHSDSILSDSEDRTLRVWDCSQFTSSTSVSTSTSRGKCMFNVKRDNDRFWCLSAHPELNIFAAGHDNGLIVFKLERERPAFTLTESADGDCLYYVRDKLIRSFALDGGEDSDQFVAPLENSIKLPASVSFSPTERAILIDSADGNGLTIQLRDKSIPPAHFVGLYSTFVGRNRFVSLSLPGPRLSLHTLGDQASQKQFPLPAENIIRLLPGPMGTFLAVAPGTVFMIDGTSGRIISQIEANGVKYASWSSNYEHVALMGKKTIYLSDKSFKSVSKVHQDVSGVKSGTWDVSNPIGAIFYYTNAFHLKYLLPQGDSGIICTTSTLLYLVRVRGDLVHVLDRQMSVMVLAIDPTECHFKLALHIGDMNRINDLIANANLVGQAIIAYLREKGHAAIALQFVKDPTSRFELALECLDLNLALEAAQALDSSAIWNRLADEALQMGKVTIALDAYERANNNSRLSFLDTILSNDSAKSSIFDALMKNDAASATKLFIQNDLPVLAHLSSSGRTAVTVDSADLGNFLLRRSLTKEPTGIKDLSDWPLLFDPINKVAFTSTAPIATAVKKVTSNDGWGNMEDLDVEFDSAPTEIESLDAFGDDFDIPLDEDDFALLGSEGARASEIFDLELPDELPAMKSLESLTSSYSVASLAQEYILQNNLIKLSPSMMEAVEKIVASQNFHIPTSFGSRRLPIPNAFSCIKFNEEAEFSTALTATTQGRFPEAISHFRKFLQLAAVTYIQCDPKEMILARDYIIALLVECRRKDLGESGNVGELIDLAILFTRSPLKPEHHLLSLRAALALAYKSATYKTAAHLARRIISLPSVPEAVTLQARKVLAVAEKSNYSEAIDSVKYGAFADDSPWTIDPVAFARIENVNECGGECQYCHAKYVNAHESCSVCEIGRLNIQ